jgi:hypothetical protein
VDPNAVIYADCFDAFFRPGQVTLGEYRFVRVTIAGPSI